VPGSLSIQDGVLGAGGHGRLESLPCDAHKVAAHRLQYELSARVVHHQSRSRVVISETGSSATRVATGVGRLDVVDEQGTSFAESQPTVVGRLTHHLATMSTAFVPRTLGTAPRWVSSSIWAANGIRVRLVASR